MGGSYQAARIIQFHVEFWDRTPLGAADDLWSRQAHRCAAGDENEHDTPDYSKDPNGEVIALDSHIRLANPRTPETQSSLMMRRGYSYSLGLLTPDNWIWGCYSFAISTIWKRVF